MPTFRKILALSILLIALFSHAYGDQATLNAGAYFEAGPICVGFELRGQPGFFVCEEE